MSTLSDLLGIQHFTTSNGGSVRRDFIEEVALALGANTDTLAGLTKDGVLATAWELARGEHMPDEVLSNGATITNAALEGIIEGIVANGIEPEPLDQSPTGGFYDLEDDRRRRVAVQAVRDGQGGFRNAVLEAYDNSCAVTGANLPAALQAAHIAPYMGMRSHAVNNGLCLRADIHGLFDRHMLAIHEVDMTVLLAPAVLASSYADLNGFRITLPRHVADEPDPDALAHHRQVAGL